MKNKKFFETLIFYWLPVIAWSAIIFIFSAQPTGVASEIDWQDFFLKKSAHVVVFFVLCTLTYRALLREGVSKKKATVCALLFSILYGASDEFHQSFTPGRDPRVRDVLIDTVGALLAIYIIWNIVPKMPESIKNLAKRAGLH